MVFATLQTSMWHTGAIMLIEVWERLRGYDKWLQTEATIESSKVEEQPITNRSGAVMDYAYSSGDVLTWTDGNGEKQYADFSVPEESPLFQLIGGETVTIRYNPAKPDEFYYRELLRTKVHSAFKTTLICGLIIGFFVLLFTLRIAGNTSRR
jgi:hypothetical protein